MAIFSIPVMKLKPGQSMDLDFNTSYLTGNTSFSVEGGDNGVLLHLIASEECTVTVHGGEGPLAGGDLIIPLDVNYTKVIWLETGRYADRDGVISLSCDSEETEGYVIQLV